MSEKPLAGKRILVTRARGQASALSQRIEALGGEVIELPTIEIQPPSEYIAFDAALARIESFDWLFFTSVNSVAPFLSRLTHVAKTVAELAALKVAAVGVETAKRLVAGGISLTLVPSRYQVEGLLDSLDPKEMAGKRVLIPQAAKARELLSETLRQWGAEVTVIEAYRTVAPARDWQSVKERLRLGGIDIVTFTSSSTAENFAQLFDGAMAATIGNTAIACIGPITAKTVQDLGGQVAILAPEATIDGLVRGLVEYCRAQPNANAEHS